jgi:3D (Asp-Asp-Asp) domain-containing protein
MAKICFVAWLGAIVQIGASAQGMSSDSVAKVSGGGEAGESEIPVPAVGMKSPMPELKIVPREALLHDPFNFAAPLLRESQSFNATAYALKGLTRSGVYVRRGVIAADPEVLPLGSVVQVTAGNYSGVYTVHDTGKRIRGNVVDIWVPTRGEARRFGRQRVKIQVLKMGRTRNRR